MRLSCTIPVTCFLRVHDRSLEQDAATILTEAIEFTLRNGLLNGPNPQGYASLHSFLTPNDTYIRVEPGEDGGIEASVAIF